MKNYLEMSNEERSELRKLQDEFIILAEKKGVIDNDTVIDCFPKITLGDLRKAIYPQYEDIFRDYVNSY